MAVTEQEIAEWMVNEVKEKGTLHQSAAIEHIKTAFGEEFVFVNENGHPSLAKEVRKAFRKVHNGKIAWDREGFFWAWT